MLTEKKRLELLKFCVAWNKPLSDEFIICYCEFRNKKAMINYAYKNKVSLRRFNKRFTLQMGIDIKNLYGKGMKPKQIAWTLDLNISKVYREINNLT